MQTASLKTAELEEAWSESDPTLHSRSTYPLYWGSGTSGSSVVVFELDPDRHLGLHVHSAEEIVLVLGGEVEVQVGEESGRLAEGELAVVPPRTTHDVRNVGSGLARCVGFFPSAAIATVFEDVLEPAGERVEGTPPPEDLLD